MNHASGAVAPPDAEVVQAGDAIWQRAKRRGLVQGAVWPVRVVEVLVVAELAIDWFTSLLPAQATPAPHPG